MTYAPTIPAQNLLHIDVGRSVILDVRTMMEHNEKHLGQKHIHVPLDEIKPAEFMQQQGLDKSKAVYLLCRSGKRAAQAAEKFKAEGFTNVQVIEGGIIACEECGHSIEGRLAKNLLGAAKGSISLERQVRIAAGLFVVTGAALALTVNTLFAALPLCVGCGLVFAGVTDKCGLALVLTQAPWNRIKPTP